MRVFWVSAENRRIMDSSCACSAELAEHAKFGEKTDNTECHKLVKKLAILSTDKMEFEKKNKAESGSKNAAFAEFGNFFGKFP